MQDDLRREQVAHVFRRCGFGPLPGEVDRWADAGPNALIEALLEDGPEHAREPDEVFEGLDPDDLDDAVLELYFRQMMSAENPLHERMTWYWQTHFTSSVEASAPRFVWQQHHLVRRHALGNFATLARQITTDPAMLFYLDGAGSQGNNPNENYAREFLELFTLGRAGGYNEDDVRAAARILAGWHVDWETGEVEFNEDYAYQRPVTFMGERRRWDLDAFVEFVCGQPACHRHVVERLYHHVVGPDLEPERHDELAVRFRDADLEIKPLLVEMLTGPEFLTATHSRARQPIEWTIAALRALGHDDPASVDLRAWHFEALGQLPYRPPNVGGWPLDDRWGSPSQLITRMSFLIDWELPESTITAVPPTVDAVLDRCGIYNPSETTRSALDGIEADHPEYDYRLELLFAATLTSPEFTLL